MIAMLTSIFKPFTVVLFLISIVAIGVGGAGLPFVMKYLMVPHGTLEDKLGVLEQVMFFSACLSGGIAGLLISGLYAVLFDVMNNMRVVAKAVSRPRKPQE